MALDNSQAQSRNHAHRPTAPEVRWPRAPCTTLCHRKYSRVERLRFGFDPPDSPWCRAAWVRLGARVYALDTSWCRAGLSEPTASMAPHRLNGYLDRGTDGLDGPSSAQRVPRLRNRRPRWPLIGPTGTAIEEPAASSRNRSTAPGAQVGHGAPVDRVCTARGAEGDGGWRPG